jgi:flavin-dependent dehydrogenase
MTVIYDIVIVGGGPGGLATAMKAAQDGMKVVLVERKRDLTEINRLCGQFANISLISVTGKYKYGYSEPVNLESATSGFKLSYPTLGFSVDYAGPLRPYQNYLLWSPSGYQVYREKNRFYGFFWEKERVLEGLLEKATKAGATILQNTVALGGENTPSGVKVRIQDASGVERVIEGKRGVAADGHGSKIVDTLGLNEGRPEMAGAAGGIGYVLEGVETEHRLNTWNAFTIPSLAPVGNIWMFMVAGDRNIVGTVARSGRSPAESTDLFMKLPFFAPWFRHAKLIKRIAFGMSGMRAPLRNPIAGHWIILGEATGLGETSNPGAIACGWQAARLTAREMQGQPGYKEYNDWWQAAFEGNDPDYFKAAGRFFIMNSLCTDAETDYLYNMVAGQVGVPAILIAQNLERVKAEKPDLYEKLQKVGLDQALSAVKIDLHQVMGKK